MEKEKKTSKPKTKKSTNKVANKKSTRPVKKVETKKEHSKVEKPKVKSSSKKTEKLELKAVIIVVMAIVVMVDLFLAAVIVKDGFASYNKYTKSGVSFNYAKDYRREVTINGSTRKVLLTSKEKNAEIEVNIVSFNEELKDNKQYVIAEKYAGTYIEKNSSKLRFVYGGNIFTDNKLSGKDYLFRNVDDKEQVNINVFFAENKLVAVILKAKDKNFDFALPDVQEIISSLQIK